MSRIAKNPLVLPDKVEISVDEETVTVKGPKGTLTQHKNRLVRVDKSDEVDRQFLVRPATNDSKAWAHAGTVRALIANMFHGVTNGFDKTLELVGVGYRAQMKGNALSLSLGYSHTIEYQLPDAVTVELPANTTIILKAMDKQLLGQVAAEIRALRPPEPYKGKGVRYKDEVIVRKEAKKK